jgi:hypothetical protein
MASQQESAALGAPPKADHACQKAAALLNSRFSTFRDLDALESLVWDAEERHVLLQTKVHPPTLAWDNDVTHQKYASLARIVKIGDECSTRGGPSLDEYSSPHRFRTLTSTTLVDR